VTEDTRQCARPPIEPTFIEGWEPETREPPIEPFRLRPVDIKDGFARIWRWTPESDDEDAVP
jgi:hypothetical protein